MTPDAILMGYRLGDGGDGLAAARRIREANYIPIIFCTAYVHCLRPEVLTVPRAQLIAKTCTTVLSAGGSRMGFGRSVVNSNAQ